MAFKKTVSDGTFILLYVKKEIKSFLELQTTVKDGKNRRVKRVEGLLMLLRAGIAEFKSNKKVLPMRYEKADIVPEPLKIPNELHDEILDIQEWTSAERKSDLIIALMMEGIKSMQTTV
jgi:hypothetical protein